MKKKYFLSFLLLCSIIGYTQEGIFYQAEHLKSKYKSGKITIDERADAVLVSNLRTLFKVKNTIELTEAINSNPFFKEKKITLEIGEAQGAAANYKAFNAFSLNSIGNIDVTTAAQGLSQFLIKRAKEELTVAFFNRFKKFSEDNPEFKILFPKTTDKLANLLTYTYPQMLPALRESFFEDLSTVTLRLDDLLAQPRYEALLKDLPEVTICIRSIKIIHQLENGWYDTADALEQFSKLPEFSTADAPTLKNTGAGLKIATVFSESLRKSKDDLSGGNIWVSGSDLKALAKDEILFTIYMGLIYQKTKYENIEYVDGTSKNQFHTLLGQKAANILSIQTALVDALAITVKIDNLVDIINAKKRAGTITNEDYYNYINESIGFLEDVHNIIDVFVDLKKTKDYYTILRKSNDIFKDTYSRQYTLLVSDLLDLFELLNTEVNNNLTISKSQAKAIQKLAEANPKDKKINKKELEAKMAAIDKMETSTDSKKTKDYYTLQRAFKFIKKAKPYALFMANIVEAKNPDDVANALESAALPVGSSSIKKNTHSNFAVQAYLGAFVSDKNNDNSSFNSSFGVIAPVGIAYTPGFASWGQGGAFSIFATLLDIGAIADYDLKREPSATQQNTETVKKDYKVKLGQIFSPGGYIVYGVGGNIPLAVGFGAQYGPGLSKVDDVSGAQVINPSWRASIFLAVDIPLFTLKNSIKENK